MFKVDLTGQEVLMQFENPVLNLWRLFIIDVLDNRDAYWKYLHTNMGNIRHQA